MDTAALLGEEADSLLTHRCDTIDRQALSLPGPEHLEQVMITATARHQCCATWPGL